MSVNKKQKARTAAQLTVLGQAIAPIVFTDGIHGYGAIAGMIQIELGSSIIVYKPDGTSERQIVSVCHLRMHPSTVNVIKKALDDCIELHRENVMRARAARQKTQRKPAAPPPEQQEEGEQEEAA
jgi:hypothetical protein